ncbi:MFS transporter [Natronosporangium hydrolyticum]|uniref:MFS transporter n=1 Tax=Natronosporangium hydrolyticum TaxID=2811111 RepID=A0A895YQ29_9ACTN|nr:MFS transporter [Natronosporangium hydrolyticum]QSB17589.1 MFS transporter [Natronosporangium hydrolyticum]
MIATWRLWRSFPWPVRLLVLNQAGINFGFYLVLPYLATYLTDDVGMSLATVAVVLAVRNLSQQGLFMVGGSASDRLGARSVIIAGCALRTVGFGLFVVAGSVPWLLMAAVLSGVAGGLFNPAARAYLADAAGDRRTEGFALFQVCGNVGSLAGPAVGSVLLLVDFRLVAAAAAVVFAGLTLAQLAALPPRPATRTGGTLRSDWRRCLTDRRFVLFTLALSATYTLQSQLYLILPVRAERATGAAWAVALLFVTATVVTVVGQVRVAQWCRRWRPGVAMATGLAVMAAGFALPALADGYLPVLAAALLLAAGLLPVMPVMLERIGAFGGRHGLAGTYFGFFYMVSGVVAAAGTAVIGWVAGRAEAATAGASSQVGAAATTAIAAPAWWLCAGLGLTAAAAVWLLERAGQLTPADSPEAAAAGAAQTTSTNNDRR